MNRRRASVVLALLLWPLSPALGQTPAKIPRIGLLSIGTDPAGPLPPQWIAFFDSLRRLGYVDGQNIVVERRFAAGNSERVPDFAAELAKQKVDVLVVTGMREVQAAHRATTTIPIVTIVAPDLVATGLVASLGRPGGNITGLSFSTSGIGEKYVELLREAVPKAARVAGIGYDELIHEVVRIAWKRITGRALPALRAEAMACKCAKRTGRLIREHPRASAHRGDGQRRGYTVGNRLK